MHIKKYFLYTNNNKCKEHKNKSNRMCTDLYRENYKTLLKALKKVNNVKVLYVQREN